MKSTKEEYSGDIIQNYFTAYVRQALKYNRISYFRKNYSRQQHELLFATEDHLSLHTVSLHNHPDDIDTNELLIPDSISHSKLAKELRNMPDKTLTIIRMRIIHGYSYKTIGSTLGMKEEAVRVRYFRAIQKIRDNMKEEQK